MAPNVFFKAPRPRLSLHSPFVQPQKRKRGKLALATNTQPTTRRTKRSGARVVKGNSIPYSVASFAIPSCCVMGPTKGKSIVTLNALPNSDTDNASKARRCSGRNGGADAAEDATLAIRVFVCKRLRGPVQLTCSYIRQ